MNACSPISRPCSRGRWLSRPPLQTRRSDCKTRRPKRRPTPRRMRVLAAIAGSGSGFKSLQYSVICDETNSGVPTKLNATNVR